MTKRFYLLISLFLTSITSLYAQTINNNWNKDLRNSLKQFLACQETPDDINECNRFTGEALKTVYKINDFYSQKLGRYLTATEIAKFLTESDKWVSIGHAYEQNVLSESQGHANSKKAVVAAYLNPSGVGYIVLITPGELQRSGSWGLNVPNAASFFLNQADKSFVDKGLSFAFGKNLMKDILLYTRKY